MTGNFREKQVCENLLNNVKSSNLNYIINETPYSSFITIRKSFTKDFRETSDVTIVDEDVSLLNSKCQRLISDIEVCKHENSDLKDSLKGYVDENVAMNQKMFIFKGELANQNETIKQDKEMIHSAERETQSVKDKLVRASKQIEEMKKAMLEKETQIEMLNMTVDNKNIEITSLKKEIIESEAVSSDEPSQPYSLVNNMNSKRKVTKD